MYKRLFFLTSIFASVGMLRTNLPARVAALAIIVAGNGFYLGMLAFLMRRPSAQTFLCAQSAHHGDRFGVAVRLVRLPPSFARTVRVALA
jgi:hypothetical protein